MRYTHHNELAAYFYSELRRLAAGEKSGPVVVIDMPANAPCPTQPSLWGGVERVRPVDAAMPPPLCLMRPDCEAGQSRRFAHARELLKHLNFR